MSFDVGDLLVAVAACAVAVGLVGLSVTYLVAVSIALWRDLRRSL